MTSPANHAGAPPARSGPPVRMKPGHWVLLVLGAVFAVLGAGLAVGGGVVLGADAAQRDGRYLTGEPERYQTAGYALVSPSVVIDPGQAGMQGVPPIADLASIQVRVTPVVPDREVFVGIAEAAKVSAYLRDVPYATLGNGAGPRNGPQSGTWPGDGDSMQRPDDADGRTTAGTRAPDDPAGQDFWAASASGTGVQEVTWDLRPGRWALVVMNADASRPVWVEMQAGVRSAVIGPVGTGMLVAGLIGLVVGIPLLLWGAAGLGRDIDPSRNRAGQGPGAALARDPGPGEAPSAAYPVRLTGFQDPRLSRGLWLVKWLLAIPHYLVLAVLWIALAVTTVAAGITVLFTGRYPRSWFLYSAGVLRWSWRVGFYAYSALGTDRYPPFTLAPAAYPADLDIAYPQRLSRGLVLVKWWLLALPHLLIIGVFTGAAGVSWDAGWDDRNGGATDWNPSLLGLLLLVAAVGMLFTGRYRPGLFALIVGINRWVYRVMAYVLLLRDEYPPFRLDQGPNEPPAERSAGPGPGRPGPSWPAPPPSADPAASGDPNPPGA